MSFQDLLNLPLFDLRGVPITIGTVFTAVVIILVSFWLSWMVRRMARRVFVERGMLETSSFEVTARLIHYTIVIVGFTVALDTVGFSLGALFAAGAVFAVAIGFAMQNIVQNFVSGVILLVERSIKPGDVIMTEGLTVQVEHMGIRSTIARTRDDERLIVPNSMLVQGMVKNYSLKDTMYRLRAEVGVVYGSDMRVVLDSLTELATALPWRNPKRGVRVQMKGFGASSVDFDVSVWMDDPWEAPMALSELYQRIWWGLKERGVVIAFPQLDLHLDPDVSQAITQLGGRTAA